MQEEEPGGYVDVDEHRLDEEWVLQPRRYRRAAERAAQLRLDYNAAKAHLELVKAELLLEIRKAPEAYDLPNATVAVIEAAVVTQSRHQKALAKLNQAKYELDVQEAAVGALEHKKKALENLTQLQARAYFAEPVAGGDAKANLDKRADRRASARVGKRLNNGA